MRFCSVGRKEPGMVGKGLNIWPNVHIDDIAVSLINLFYLVRICADLLHPYFQDLFEVVHKLALSGEKGNHGREGYFFGESGEHTLYAAGETIGQALVKEGVVKSSTPTTFTKEDIDAYFGGVSSFRLTGLYCYDVLNPRDFCSPITWVPTPEQEQIDQGK